MGELHLEVTLNQLKNNGLEVVSLLLGSSTWRASQRPGSSVGRSPNKQNSFRIKVEPQQQNAEKNRGVLVTADEHQTVY
jgi:hypothetical protein